MAGRPRAAGTRCRDALGQRGELQGKFSQGKRPVVPTRSLPAFCLFSCWRLESGRVPALHHAPRGPCVSPDLLGVPARPPRPVLAGIAPIPSSRAGCCAPLAEELRSPQGRPPPAFAAPVSRIRDLGASAGRPVTRGDGLELRRDPFLVSPHGIGGGGRGEPAVVSLRGPVGLSLLA